MGGNRINKKILLITAGIISIVVIVSFIIGILWYRVDWGTPSPSSPFAVKQDIDNKTLIVKYVREEGLSWENVKLMNDSSASLPDGTIEVEDTITNCNGSVILVWIPNNSVIAYFDFE
jgi:hypothetical protein